MSHEAAQTVAARGIRFEEIVEADPAEAAKAVVGWASHHNKSVFAMPGHPLEAPETLAILERALAAGVEVKIVSAPSDVERLPASDDLTRAHIAPEAMRAGLAFIRLVQVMGRLRGPHGCPWDREQTHESLAVHLLEETYETLEAIDGGDRSILSEELGDLLLQVVFHSELAREAGDFGVAEVIETLLSKLFHRHPHVFGDVVADDAQQVVKNWEALKTKEKARKSVADDIPRNLPALLYAYKVLRRLRADDHPKDRVGEERIGEELLRIVEIAVNSGVDPEGALRRAIGRLVEREPERERERG
jgi:uncharacterized protein YabN with tetrapyrrole methylase and pyrophosphatase domain